MSCAVCNKEETLKLCSKCHTVKYCSVECQRSDWKENKLTCCSVPSLTSLIHSVPVLPYFLSWASLALGDFDGDEMRVLQALPSGRKKKYKKSKGVASRPKRSRNIGDLHMGH